MYTNNLTALDKERIAYVTGDPNHDKYALEAELQAAVELVSGEVWEIDQLDSSFERIEDIRNILLSLEEDVMFMSSIDNADRNTIIKALDSVRVNLKILESVPKDLKKISKRLDKLC